MEVPVSISRMIIWAVLSIISEEDFHMLIFSRQEEICLLAADYLLLSTTGDYDFSRGHSSRSDRSGRWDIQCLQEKHCLTGEELYLILGTGFLFISGRFFWGISVSHLTEPDPYGSDSSDGKLNRRLLLYIAGRL